MLYVFNMSDLSEKNASGSTKVVGADNYGNESTYLHVEADGSINSRLKDGSGASVVIGQTTTANSLPFTMASNQPVIFADPLLTYLNNNKMYSLSLNVNMTSSGTDNPLVLISNPNASGKTIYIVKVMAGCNIANVAVTFNIKGTPTVTTAGSSTTPVACFIGNSAPAVTTVVTTTPTISVLGSDMASGISGQNASSVLLINEYAVALAANNKVLITGNPGSNNRNAVITIIWIEV